MSESDLKCLEILLNAYIKICESWERAPPGNRCTMLAQCMKFIERRIKELVK